MASTPLARLCRAATFAAFFMSALAGGAVAGPNPLEDFNSEPLTSNFRNSYDNVAGATVNVDVPYGLDTAQKYDVYLPDNAANAPIIVMIHGGAWTSGDKQDDNVAEAKAGYFVARGYIFVSLNYRLLPSSDPLIQAADVARGIANIQTNAAKWGGNRNKIVLMGAGSGGHLTALLSSNPSLASDQGASIWAGAVVLETSALNVPSLMASSPLGIYSTAFGTNLEFWEDASPSHLIDSSGVPMLVVCSSASVEDTCGKANAFKQKASAAGVNVTVSQQTIQPLQINTQVGVAGAYSDAIATYISSVL